VTQADVGDCWRLGRCSYYRRTAQRRLAHAIAQAGRADWALTPTGCYSVGRLCTVSVQIAALPGGNGGGTSFSERRRCFLGSQLGVRDLSSARPEAMAGRGLASVWQRDVRSTYSSALVGSSET
jgi:hypothetical protein